MSIQIIGTLVGAVIIIAGVIIFNFFLKRPPPDHDVQIQPENRRAAGGIVSLKHPTTAPTMEAKLPIPDGDIPRYKAMVFTREGIKFKKISHRTGEVWQLDPSMPVHGAYLLAAESENGQILAYDPRNESLRASVSPQKAFRAIRWEVMHRLFAYNFGIWDKINQVMTWVCMAGCFLIVIIAVGG